MKQVVVQTSGPRVVDVPAPLIETGHVLVAVEYSVISPGTELRQASSNGQLSFNRVLKVPNKLLRLTDHLRKQGITRTISLVRERLDEFRGEKPPESMQPLGYSCSGTVVQVGDQVTGFSVGDRVSCAGAGRANHAEWVLVPQNLVSRIPQGVTMRDAASATLGAIALHSIHRADLRLGEWAAVIGLGLIGQITVQIARSAGVRVIGLDIDEQRVNTAKAVGIDGAFVSADVDPTKKALHWTEGRGVDATIICARSSSNAVIQQAIELTRRRGKVVIVGEIGLSLERSPFYEKELDLLISRSSGPGRYERDYEEKGLDYPYEYVRWTENRNITEYLRLLREGVVDFRALVGAEYLLEDAEEAYRMLNREVDRPVAVVLRNPEGAYQAEPPNRRIDLRSSTSTETRSFDRPIRVAVVGAGSFAKAVHLPNLKSLASRYQLRAIVSRRGINARQVGEHFGANYATTDYDEVLNDPKVDMVLLSTRHHLHAQQAQKAAEAGKAVFLEKPMALNPKELDELIDTLDRTGVPFTVGFNRRFSPTAQRLKEILECRRSPLVMFYRVNAGYIPRDHWIQNEEGGGRIIGEACHMIDFFRFLVGSPRVDQVSSMPMMSSLDHSEGPDNCSMSVQYSDGSLASLLYTSLGTSDLPKERLEVYTEGQVFVIDDFKSLDVYGANTKGWRSPSGDKGHLKELEEFAKYLQVNGTAPIPLADLYETTRLSFIAANQSTSWIADDD